MVDRDALQRRTVAVLIVSQALGGLGLTIGIAVASVLAEDVSGSATLAGLTQTFQVLGAAAASYVLALVMGTRGRRVGLVAGYLAGAVGAGLCVLGGALDSFAVLIVGAFLLGATTASNYQSRYAAADLARPEARGRALSLVVWATTLGAVVGPNLSGPAGRGAEAMGLPRLTGPFLVSLLATFVASIVVFWLLRPDPLLTARELAGADPTLRSGMSWRKVREVAATRPAVVAGVLAISCAQAVMVAVMVMTPLHMDHGGATLDIIGLVISAHVLGMFFFAPAVGWATDRWGRRAVLAAGAGVLLVSLVLSGTSPMGASWRIGAGLFLLGLGWSLVTVAGSTLVTDSAPLEARTDVQGAADLVMNLTAAVAGALAGVVVGWQGFGALNAFASVFVVGVLVAVAMVGPRAPGLTPAAEQLSA